MPALTAVLLAVLLPFFAPHQRARLESASCAPGPTSILESGEASARVFGVYAAREARDGTTQLCVLVLWRGEINWYRHRMAVLEALKKRNPPADDAKAPLALITYEADLGDLSLSLDYDWNAHTVEVAGQVVDLRDANVVLIDRADHVGGEPVIVRTLRIAPALARELPDLKALASSNPEITKFLE